MISRFNVFHRGIPLYEAVELILVTRRNAKQEDIRAESSEVKFNGSALVVAGNVYELNESSTAALCKFLDLDYRVLSKLTKTTQMSLVNELITRKNSKMLVRVAEYDGIKCVRTVLRSKFNILDDKALFSEVLNMAKANKWDDIPVNVWVSDCTSAIRGVITELPQASNKFCRSIGYGFDVCNSELLQQSTWVKGIVTMDGDTAMIVPRVLTSKSSAEVAELMDWLKTYLDQEEHIIDTMVCGGLPLERRNVRKELDQMEESRLITKTDSAKIYASLTAESVGSMEMLSAICTYAATMDHYNKRSSLEFIPNLWCRSTRIRKVS